MAAYRLAEYLDRQQQRSNSSGSSPTVAASKRVTMPSFEIRGERVNYMELMRYFRRKKISDPVSWVKEHQDELDLSEDVVVVDADPTAEGEARSSEDDGDTSERDHREIQRLMAADLTGLEDVSSDTSHITHQISNVRCLDDQYSTLMGAVHHAEIRSPSLSVPAFLRPQTSYALEQLNYSMMTYMRSYLVSPVSKKHREPEVHAHTVHAIFASKMQDGISLLANVSPNTAKTKLRGPEPNAAQAFTSFEYGFQLIHKILTDHSPMSLALMLSIVCELANRAVKTGMKTSAVGILLAKLLTYTHDMAATVLGSGHPLTVFFGILEGEYICPTVLPSSGSLPLVELILASLKLAVAQFNISSTSIPADNLQRIQDWKQLYLRERLCDALYYCGPTYQVIRSRMRSQLFYDQEARYGPTARNVLWTLTNVADDCLANGEIDQAIGHFQEALNRTEALTEGYGRAKTSFAAREGLGRCWVRKAGEAEAEALWQQEQSRSPSSACCSCHCHYAADSKPGSSRGSTDNTGTSTPTSSGSSFSSTTLKPCGNKKPHGPNQKQEHHQYKSRSPHHHDSPSHRRLQHLRRAHIYFKEAEDEARQYFEASSRRITRVSLRRQEVVELLGIATPESSSSSGSEDEEVYNIMSADVNNNVHVYPSPPFPLTAAAAAAATNISLVLGYASDLDFDASLAATATAPATGLAMTMATPTQTQATMEIPTARVKPPQPPPPPMVTVPTSMRGFRPQQRQQQQHVQVPLYGAI
ncbi:uncharacterized protein A1O5_07533 [Cladophialophora psammophila CBS 110553]|uniref:Clr5 domain-containing protein n=1 Tax=Cladophialophora psammophila CBS 110553 TaxID=1182543 RepID=W9WMV1_9EURO|nr:uncharacterized protein A1O5_07533 [Cladophialophora psammophila CBS 110553]EXJ69497.1 hypothetical protein A1O5_07533 [Cladophialophora psammophila CBS 110553]